jgi:hypothetical protein
VGKKKFMGREYLGTHRVTFLIDPNGRVLSSLTGLAPFANRYPPLKRWAIFECPCGTNVSEVAGPNLERNQSVKSAASVVRLAAMKPVKLSDLIEAVEFDSRERITRFDLHEGRVVSVERGILSALEESDEERLVNVPDWQKEEVELARAIEADPDGRFVGAPDKFDFHEYRHMERFIQRVDNERDAEQLWRAIEGRGAFRHFKDTVSRLGLFEEWRQYRDEALKKYVAGWAEARSIAFVDDIVSRPHR